MGKLVSFNFVTLDGFFEGPEKGDISWHEHDEEGNEFASENVSGGPSTLVFGRVTYQMMFGFWSTDMGKQVNPAVADSMNKSQKIVFSRTLKSADWENSVLIKDNIAEEIQKLKNVPGRDMTILGSGSIVSQLAEFRLIDEYQLIIDPVAIGKGTTLFEGLTKKLELKLVQTRAFKSGRVLHVYENLNKSQSK